MDVAEVSERPCTMDDLREASEAFLASTTREAQSIAAIEDFELPEGERTREVRGGPARTHRGGAGRVLACGSSPSSATGRSS